MTRSTILWALGLAIAALAIIVGVALSFGAEWAAAPRPAGEGVRPLPLLALALAVSIAAIGYLLRAYRRIMTGRSAPNSEERAGILSAMLVVAVARGRTSRDEFLSTYQVVTGHRLEDIFADLAMDRYEGLMGTDASKIRIDVISSAIGRRRALGAAMLMAHPMRGVPAMQSLIGHMADQIGATEGDCRAVRVAIDDWNADCREITEVPLVSLLRHRPLILRPV